MYRSLKSSNSVRFSSKSLNYSYCVAAILKISRHFESIEISDCHLLIEFCYLYTDKHTHMETYNKISNDLKLFKLNAMVELQTLLIMYRALHTGNNKLPRNI